MQNPVIVLPGIEGSELRDEYPVKPETLWSAVADKKYERMSLHPDNVRYEAIEPARVREDIAFPLIYGDLIAELQHDLTDHADRPVPVYPFPYDWRKPLDVAQAKLADFVDEVIGRTRLLRHYHAGGYDADPKVDLVGHSMGGLVITGYLQAAGANARVGKVATMGTPFRGSFEAPIKVLTGTASLGGGGSNSRERDAARLAPGLYHLLPDYPGAVLDPQGAPVDLYAAGAWQPGVFGTLAEFIRIYGVDSSLTPAQRNARAVQVLQAILDQARAFKQRTTAFQLGQAGLDASKWMCIVGVNAVTRVRLQMDLLDGQPRYDLTSSDRMDAWTPTAPSVLTGDNTVPYLGAKPDFLGVENLVCVRPDDFGYWELGDKTLAQAAGFHASLPTVNLVQRLVVAHLKGLGGSDNIWARPAPDIGGAAWAPPIPGLARKP